MAHGGARLSAGPLGSATADFSAAIPSVLHPTQPDHPGQDPVALRMRSPSLDGAKRDWRAMAEDDGHGYRLLP